MSRLPGGHAYLNRLAATLLVAVALPPVRQYGAS